MACVGETEGVGGGGGAEEAAALVAVLRCRKPSVEGVVDVDGGGDDAGTGLGAAGLVTGVDVMVDIWES